MSLLDVVYTVVWVLFRVFSNKQTVLFLYTTAHHTDTKTGKHHEHIIMDFVWFEDHDHDIHTALFALYSLSVVVSVVLFTLMFVPSEIVRKGQMLVKDLRSQ